MKMTKILYCDSLEEYIQLIVKKELIGEYYDYKIKLNDKKNKIKI